MFNELKKALENYKFDKIKLQYGRYGELETPEGKKEIKFSNDSYKYLKGDKVEIFNNNKIIREGQYIQEIYGNNICFFLNGKVKCFEDNYFGEYFYDERIGRGKINGNSNEKFFFLIDGYLEGKLKDPEKKDDITIYKIKNDPRIILEKNNINDLVRIFVKDIKNEKNIYEINVNMGEQRIKGNGVVYDNRKKELLFVNFDNNNILSKNLYNLNTFIDRNELEVNEKINNTKDPKSILKDVINEILSKEENIEFIANLINKKMIKEKINILGVRDQHYSPECWVHALSEIVFMSNSRKYGRKMESFNKIYDNIIREYSKKGKTNGEIEKIMTFEFAKI